MTREHLMCVFDINPKVAMIQYKDGRWKTIKTVVDHHGVHKLVLIAICSNLCCIKWVEFSVV